MESLKNKEDKNLSLRESLKAKKELASLLESCWNTLNTYGKEPEAMKDTVIWFIRVLADNTTKEITVAFIKYMKINSVMPTPSDIYKLIPIERTDLIDFRESDEYKELANGT